MKLKNSGPARNQARYNDNNKVAVHEFKPCAQSRLPDNRLFKEDLLDAVQKALAAHQSCADTLFVLKSHLEEALDRDDDGGMC